MLLFLIAVSKVIALPTIAKVIDHRKKIPITFCYRLSEPKRATTVVVAIVGRAIIIWEAVQKRNLEPICKTYTKNKAK